MFWNPLFNLRVAIILFVLILKIMFVCSQFNFIPGIPGSRRLGSGCSSGAGSGCSSRPVLGVPLGGSGPVLGVPLGQSGRSP